jgi:hypothetical protein
MTPFHVDILSGKLTACFPVFGIGIYVMGRMPQVLKNATAYTTNKVPSI